MADQSLREALEALAKERDSVSGHAASDYHIRPYELFELLAAHPAEPAPGTCTCPPHPNPEIDGPGDWDPNCKLHQPAPDRQPSDAAVEALAASMFESVHEMDWAMAEGVVRAQWLKRGRAALEAAYRVDAPRPAIEREALVEMLWDYPHPAIKNRQTCEMEADQILKLARPMPSEDEIGAAITKAVAEYRGYLVFDGLGSVAAAAVLALLNGAE